MTDVASLVLFTSDLDGAADFCRALGVPLEDEDHGEGPRHTAPDLNGVHLALQQMPWGCRFTAQDPDDRDVEVNGREHCLRY